MEKSVRDLHLDRKKMWDASMKNHVRYIDPNTGKFSTVYMESRQCPVCGNKENSETLFDKSGGEYCICRSCEMIYLNPVFKDYYLEEYYSINHSVQSEVVENDSEFYISLYMKGLSQIGACMAHKGRILDVGCSSGVFLGQARKEGWKTVGVELNSKEAEHCRSKGHTVYSQSIQNPEVLSTIGMFDAITLWDVFEHIKDGVQLLNAFKNIIAPNGVVFLQVPSGDSIAARILQEKCNMFDGLEHVNIYSLKALKQIAESCGFRLITYSTVIPEIGVLNNYLHYENPYLGSQNDKLNLLGIMDSESLLKANLGYKIQATFASI